MSTGMELKKAALPRVELSSRGKLILTSQLQAQIAYLHREVKDVEWIGILLYKKEAGDIEDPSTLVLRADRLFLMDVGTSGHTEAIVDSDEILNMWDQIPDMIDLKQGLIHTHHTMGAFFSGEDWSELNDNAELHNYYLSLIVNHAGTYVAKVAYVADSENEIKFKNSEDQLIVSKTTKKILVTMDMTVWIENNPVDQVFRDRYSYIKEKTKPKSYTAVAYPRGTTHTPGQPGYWQGTQWVPDNFDDTWEEVSHKDWQTTDKWDPKDKVWKRKKKAEMFMLNGNWEESADWEETDYRGKGENGVFDRATSTWYRRISGGGSSKQGELGLGEVNQKETFPKGRENTRDTSSCITTFQAKGITLEWLNMGLKIETFMEGHEFRTITEAIRYFEEYFDEKFQEPNYKYFLDCMQIALMEASADYKPSVIAVEIPKVMREWGKMFGYPTLLLRVAKDLANIAEAFPIYLKMMRTKEDKEPISPDTEQEENDDHRWIY